jgi:hypothetical protein
MPNFGKHLEIRLLAPGGIQCIKSA